jgi:hypothetical protein
MTPEDEHHRFKKQFTAKEWIQLNKHSDFIEALALDNFALMGEIADKVIYGNTDSVEQAKKRKEQFEYRKANYPDDR